MPEISKRQKISGIIAKRGYRYQDIIVAFKLLIKKFREVNYEAEGADYIHDHYNNYTEINIIEFYQCKHQETGGYQPKSFFKEVFPTFIKLYQDYVERDKSLVFVLETNQSFQPTLRTFFTSCLSLARNRISTEKFFGQIRRFRSLDSQLWRELKNLKKQEHSRFLRGIRGSQVPCESVIYDLINFLKKRFPHRYEDKIYKVIGYIFGQDQGTISRQELFSKCKIPHSFFPSSEQFEDSLESKGPIQQLRDFQDKIRINEKETVSNIHSSNRRIFDVLSESINSIDDNAKKIDLKEELEQLSETEAKIIEDKETLSQIYKERSTVYADLEEKTRMVKMVRDRWNYAFDDSLGINEKEGNL
ncbi:hypothetical protein LCGC14_1518220 [marine sediment metagenome]|uniref:Uncharacterized protein n=1 Tax=marine sediment metagenome TaxID=412755 RepID=A0A0F9IZH0_9ZZZZ|nr:hypothetical protein [bacterium]